MEKINLIPAPRGQARICRRRLRQWLTGTVACCATLLVICSICHVVWGGERNVLAGQISSTEAEIGKSGREIQALRIDCAETRWKLSSHRAIGKQPDWSILLGLLAENIGQDIVLERCRLRWVKGLADSSKTGVLRDSKGPKDSSDGVFVFKISGYGRSQPSVPQFVLRLEKTTLFDQVRLIKTNRQAFLDGKAVAFELECRLECKPTPEQ